MLQCRGMPLLPESRVVPLRPSPAAAHCHRAHLVLRCCEDECAGCKSGGSRIPRPINRSRHCQWLHSDRWSANSNMGGHRLRNIRFIALQHHRSSGGFVRDVEHLLGEVWRRLSSLDCDNQRGILPDNCEASPDSVLPVHAQECV